MALQRSVGARAALGERLTRRVPFELVQKAAVAGAPILVGVGAPSSLAIRLAGDRGLTLCGFARRGRMNVYTGAERVAGDREPRVGRLPTWTTPG